MNWFYLFSWQKAHVTWIESKCNAEACLSDLSAMLSTAQQHKADTSILMQCGLLYAYYAITMGHFKCAQETLTLCGDTWLQEAHVSTEQKLMYHIMTTLCYFRQGHVKKANTETLPTIHGLIKVLDDPSGAAPASSTDAYPRSIQTMWWSKTQLVVVAFVVSGIGKGFEQPANAVSLFKQTLGIIGTSYALLLYDNGFIQCHSIDSDIIVPKRTIKAALHRHGSMPSSFSAIASSLIIIFKCPSSLKRRISWQIK